MFHKGIWVPPRLTLGTALKCCAVPLLPVLTTLKVMVTIFLFEPNEKGENIAYIEHQGDQPTAHSYRNILLQAIWPCLDQYSALGTDMQSEAYELSLELDTPLSHQHRMVPFGHYSHTAVMSS